MRVVRLVTLRSLPPLFSRRTPSRSAPQGPGFAGRDGTTGDGRAESVAYVTRNDIKSDERNPRSLSALYVHPSYRGPKGAEGGHSRRVMNGERERIMSETAGRKVRYGSVHCLSSSRGLRPPNRISPSFPPFRTPFTRVTVTLRAAYGGVTRVVNGEKGGVGKGSDGE